MCGWTGSHHIDQSGLGRLLVNLYNRRQFQTWYVRLGTPEKYTNRSTPDVLRNDRLLKKYQFTVFDDQDFRVVDGVSISIEGELAENCVKISNISESIPN